LLPAAVVGCVSSVPDDAATCTADLRPAIEVEVRDVRTDRSIAEHVVAVVRDGAYQDTLRPRRLAPDSANVHLVPLSLAGAEERPGAYTIEVKALGYRDTAVAGITVGRNSCHVNTSRLVIRLEDY
jgi:hypothetical protein